MDLCWYPNGKENEVSINSFSNPPTMAGTILVNWFVLICDDQIFLFYLPVLRKGNFSSKGFVAQFTGKWPFAIVRPPWMNLKAVGCREHLFALYARIYVRRKEMVMVMVVVVEVCSHTRATAGEDLLPQAIQLFRACSSRSQTSRWAWVDWKSY